MTKENSFATAAIMGLFNSTVIICTFPLETLGTFVEN